MKAFFFVEVALSKQMNWHAIRFIYSCTSCGMFIFSQLYIWFCPIHIYLIFHVII
jgi:hypothetical protein